MVKPLLTNRNVGLVLLALQSIILSTGTRAAWSEQEIRAMPPYCAARYSKETDHSEYKRWEDRYGHEFLHIHHLCNGVGALNRAYKSRNDQERRGLLTQVMNEFDYVINHVRPDFPLLSDLYLYRSDAQRLNKNDAAALSDAIRSISIDARQTRAYLVAADLYIKGGNKDKALSILTDGLSQLPENQSLRKRYIELGGKPERIPPAAPKAANSSPQPNQPSQSGDGEGRAQNTGEAQAAVLNYALYSFSRVGSGGMKHGYNAGDHVYLEVTEDPKRQGQVVLFRIISNIPEPHSRIGSIGFDLGKYTNLFTKLEPDRLLGQYYKITYNATPYTHAAWPDFRAHYFTEFNIDARIAKPNDPRALSPGNSLTISAYLQPGMRFEDVAQALNLGLRREDGLRIAIIGRHLAGAPLPSGTRSDDGGYFTGRLLKATGPHVARLQPAVDDPPTNSSSNITSTPPQPPLSPAMDKPTIPDRPVNPRNPWCRFCPTE